MGMAVMLLVTVLAGIYAYLSSRARLAKSRRRYMANVLRALVRMSMLAKNKRSALVMALKRAATLGRISLAPEDSHGAANLPEAGAGTNAGLESDSSLEYTDFMHQVGAGTPKGSTPNASGTAAKRNIRWDSLVGNTPTAAGPTHRDHDTSSSDVSESGMRSVKSSGNSVKRFDFSVAASSNEGRQASDLDSGALPGALSGQLDDGSSQMSDRELSAEIDKALREQSSLRRKQSSVFGHRIDRTILVQSSESSSEFGSSKLGSAGVWTGSGPINDGHEVDAQAPDGQAEEGADGPVLDGQAEEGADGDVGSSSESRWTNKKSNHDKDESHLPE